MLAGRRKELHLKQIKSKNQIGHNVSFKSRNNHRII